jgi:hypothetical protein
MLVKMKATNWEFSNRALIIGPGAEDFTLLLKSHIARWTGRSGVQ